MVTTALAVSCAALPLLCVLVNAPTHAVSTLSSVLATLLAQDAAVVIGLACVAIAVQPKLINSRWWWLVVVAAMVGTPTIVGGQPSVPSHVPVANNATTRTPMLPTVTAMPQYVRPGLTAAGLPHAPLSAAFSAEAISSQSWAKVLTIHPDTMCS